jgi:hypothetical protein
MVKKATVMALDWADADLGPEPGYFAGAWKTRPRAQRAQAHAFDNAKLRAHRHATTDVG